MPPFDVGLLIEAATMVKCRQSTCPCSPVVSLHVHVLVHLQTPAVLVQISTLLPTLISASSEIAGRAAEDAPPPSRKHVEVVRWITKSQCV